MRGDDWQGSEEVPDTAVMASGGASSLSAILRALSNRRRRHVLYYLRERGTATIDELAQYIATVESDPSEGAIPQGQFERIRIQLYHTHLPKLVDALVVDYDERTETVTYSQPPGRLEQFIRLCNRIEEVQD